jgi:hypothetical protein
MIPDLSGGLFVPDFRSLLIADLHLEKGSSLARRGVHVPPYDTLDTLLQLEAALAAVRPERLIFLGDSFHDGEARERIAAIDLERLKTLTATVATVWIRGNHDPSPPEDLGGSISDAVVLGPVTLRHEPSALAPDECEIAGHLHPAATLEQRGHRIRCKCFIGDARRVIMPAFGSYTGALSISAEPFRRLFSERSYHVWMLGGRAVHKFPGRRVR